MGATAPPPDQDPAPGPLLVSLRLPAAATAVPTARHALRAALAGRRAGMPLDTLELLLSELVTNAVRHSPTGRTFAVAVMLREGAVRIAVVDAESRAPEPGDAVDLLDEHGRGLLLVEAMAEEWGSYPVPEGKVVWCDVKYVA